MLLLNSQFNSLNFAMRLIVQYYCAILRLKNE